MVLVRSSGKVLPDRRPLKGGPMENAGTVISVPIHAAGACRDNICRYQEGSQGGHGYHHGPSERGDNKNIKISSYTQVWPDKKSATTGEGKDIGTWLRSMLRA